MLQPWRQASDGPIIRIPRSCNYSCLTVPSAPPLSVVVEALSPTVAKLTWKPPAPEHRNGRVREYSVIRVTLPSGDLQELKINQREIVFNDLHPYTTYFFLVAAKTVSLGPFSPQVFVNMPQTGEGKKGAFCLKEYLKITFRTQP